MAHTPSTPPFYLIEAHRFAEPTLSLYAAGTPEFLYWTKNPLKALTSKTFDEANDLKKLVKHHIRATHVALHELHLAVSPDSVTIVHWRE